MDQKKRLVTTYTSFLKRLEHKEVENDTYVKIPKKLLFDRGLKEKERLTWETLAAHQYKSRSKIFPGRERLAVMLGIKDIRAVSKLTSALQCGGYLTKTIAKNNKVFYQLYFYADIDEHVYAVEKTRSRLSKRNCIRGTLPPSV
jgi:hypothetical protein